MIEKLTDKEVFNEKIKKRMNGIAKWCAFYRSNPHRFCKDYLNVTLKLFQKILLYAMMHNNYFMFLACRGIGKTWLISLFCVVRCILFPGTKIVVASGTKTQANEVLSKIIDDFCKNYEWGSENLRREIFKERISATESYIQFKNASWIKVVTSSDTARGARANVVVIDEFRMVDLNVINTVLRKFLTTPRQPGFLKKKKYEHLTERNKEMYMSSCWLKSHWSYEKVQSYVAAMLDPGRKYFICGLPYQIAIKEGLLEREQVEDEMAEADFNQMIFDMEMGCLWFGDTDGTFFKYDDISKCRRLKEAFPTWTELINNTSKLKLPKRMPNEKRVLSIDVALMGTKKNDASSIMINRALSNERYSFVSNIVLSEAHEGLLTEDLGLLVMRYFYAYDCTDVVLDCSGNGMGIYDYIIKDRYDPETNQTYVALTCINNPQMADRCTTPGARKVVWSVKGNSAFNTEVCTYLRSSFQSQKINLLVPEYEAREYLTEKKILSKDTSTQLNQLSSYIDTSLLVQELISLDYEGKGTNIKITEKSNMRKDRYSSLGYNNWVIVQLERQLRPKNTRNRIESYFVGRKPTIRKY